MQRWEIQGRQRNRKLHRLCCGSLHVPRYDQVYLRRVPSGFVSGCEYVNLVPTVSSGAAPAPVGQGHLHCVCGGQGRGLGRQPEVRPL